MSTNTTRRTFLTTLGAAAAAGAMAQTALGQAAGGAAGAAAGGGGAGGIKIVGISCSLRKGKGTSTALQACLDAAKAAGPGIEVELVELADLKIPPGPAAGVALEPGQADDFPKLLAKLTDPKVAGIILGSPVYMGNVSALATAFIDRGIAFRTGWPLRNKVGGALAVGGGPNGGQDLVALTLIHALMRFDMIVVSEGGPTSHGRAMLSSGNNGVENDAAGMATAKGLGKRVAEVALKMAAK